VPVVGGASFVQGIRGQAEARLQRAVRVRKDFMMSCTAIVGAVDEVVHVSQYWLLSLYILAVVGREQRLARIYPTETFDISRTTGPVIHFNTTTTSEIGLRSRWCGKARIHIMASFLSNPCTRGLQVPSAFAAAPRCLSMCVCKRIYPAVFNFVDLNLPSSGCYRPAWMQPRYTRRA
jgi:hypothetical protein